jgi:hypothetical protein
VDTTAVSSAKLAVVDSGKVGRSAVYSRYNNGPRTLSLDPSSRQGGRPRNKNVTVNREKRREI